MRRRDRSTKTRRTTRRWRSSERCSRRAPTSMPPGSRTPVLAGTARFQQCAAGGGVPAMRGGWERGLPHEKGDYLPLTTDVLAAHLKGDVHVGVYPLLDRDRCWWLAADFDGQDALTDALMYVKAGRAFEVPVTL